MILSFHPCIDADVSVIVAGRAPSNEEELLIRRADAIILPQGVRKDLYSTCRRACQRVFPNYDLRFTQTGKTGDTRLFRRFDLPHPRTLIFSSVAHYCRTYPPDGNRVPFPLPFVLKGNSSGEGHLVFKFENSEQLTDILEKLAAMESHRNHGFIVQQWIDHGGRDLRVVVLHDELLSYWRVQNDPEQFLTNLSAGGVIDNLSYPDLRQKAEDLVRRLCWQTRINLAGVDLMFDVRDKSYRPLLIEINYWFGRRFFRSSENYYSRLKAAIGRWLAGFNPEWAKRIR